MDNHISNGKGGPMTKGYAKPPKYGARLLPQVVDELAQSNPNRVYMSIPKSSDVSQGFRNVIMREMAQAANHMAWWMEKHLGRSKDFETIAYMGVPDVRYSVLFLAAVKCGYKILLPSPRNSQIMNLSLLEQTKCTKFFYSSEMKPKIPPMQAEKKELECFAVPSFDEMLEGRIEHYPYDETFAEAVQNPILVLHSSGSTGNPKPITMNHGTFAALDNDRNISTTEGRKNQAFTVWDFNGGGRFYTVFPPFHIGGFFSYVVAPIFSTTATPILGPAGIPPSGSLVSQIMHYSSTNALFCPPVIVEQLLQEPGGFDQAKQLDFIFYAGGPLSPPVGDLLCKVTDLCQFYGSTETGPIQAFVPTKEDWSYLEWHPVCKAEMQPALEGTYELVFPNDPSVKAHLPVFSNFPDVKEWRTRDLFKQHPTKPNLWQFHGRADDVIVLANSEKFNPSSMESRIQGHPLVAGALIVGQGRPQGALLIEPKQSDMPSDKLIDEVWPFVEQANLQAPTYARIVRSKIGVGSPDKPFSRAAKGTIVRKLTEKAYASEIDNLYKEMNSHNREAGAALAAPYDLKGITEFVRASVIPSLLEQHVSETDDFFVLGLDSLKTTEVAEILKASLQQHYKDLDLSWLSSRTIYTSPTIERLSKTIHNILSSDSISEAGQSKSKQSRTAIMAAMVEKYTMNLPRRSPKTIKALSSSPLNVVLTGSTGSLGTHLLKVLLENPKISKVYCLNRSGDAHERHEKVFAERGLKIDLKSPQIEFLQVDFCLPQFGLSPSKFTELTDSVDIIVHNAWKVDFNHSLESFEDHHIRGVRTVIDWSITSHRSPRIFFVSSISSVGNWAAVYSAKESVPETPLDDYLVAQEMGYGESKHVSERILGIASSRSSVPVNILRVGQIAGPLASKSGAWPKDEWVPSLIQTSKSLSLIPTSLPPIDWIPVDTLASIIYEIISHPETHPTYNIAKVYNLVNPHLVPWSTVIPPLESHLGALAKAVPLADWVAKLKATGRSNQAELAQKPALKILGFYEGLEHVEPLTFETENGQEVSKTMKGMGPVKAEWMEEWLRQLAI